MNWIFLVASRAFFIFSAVSSFLRSASALRSAFSLSLFSSFLVSFPPPDLLSFSSLRAFFAPSRSILMEVPKIRALARGENLSDESASGETWSLCGETLSASDETLSASDETLSASDEALSASDEALSANDVCGETLSVNDETGGAEILNEKRSGEARCGAEILNETWSGSGAEILNETWCGVPGAVSSVHDRRP